MEFYCHAVVEMQAQYQQHKSTRITIFQPTRTSTAKNKGFSLISKDEDRICW